MLTDAEIHQAVVYGRTPQDWYGWRFTAGGRYLVTPDGVKISPERIKGIAWRQDAEARRDAARARNARKSAAYQVTVVRLPLADWHRERFGTAVA